MIIPFHALSAALFDLDGTLVETHIDFGLMRRETAALLAEYGLKADPEAQFDILGTIEHACSVLREEGRGDAARVLRASAFARLEKIEIMHCGAPTQIPGATEVLAALRASGIPVAIVTRNCRAVSEELVRFANLPHDALVTRDDVPRAKPDPSHLTAAIASIRGNDPVGAGAVMVGDHWMDVAGGTAAGLFTVGLLKGRPPDFYSPAVPDMLLDELSELLPYLSRGLNSRASSAIAAG